MGVDQIVGQQIFQSLDILRRHRAHTLPVEIDDCPFVARHFVLQVN